MESKRIIIGIDVSKATLDICLLKDGQASHQVINNTVKAIRSFLKQFDQPERVTVGMENTGRYNWALYEVLGDCPMVAYVIAPLHLKKSLGLTRGKSDKIDAARIARFVEKNRSELTEWQPPRKQLQQLKVLLTERNYRIKMKRQLQMMRNDYKMMKSIQLDKDMESLNADMIQKVDEQIKTLEQRIEAIIQSDEQLKQQAKLVRSVPGVGKVLCWYLIAKTNEFKSITEPRKMACYSGVVPFEHQSGSSIKWKQQVSVFADKIIKTLLHLGAMSAIRLDNDLRAYYLRKTAQGKHKMSVLNAIRNKIIHRVYAVLKRQQPYQINLSMS